MDLLTHIRAHTWTQDVHSICICLGANLIIWSAKKQSTMSRSSAKSEYMCLANGTTEVV